MTEKLIVVLGMHRCGTSAMARGLKALGVSLGSSFLESQEDNPKGFWEDAQINAINVEMLDAINREWHDLSPIPPTTFVKLLESEFFMRAVDLLRTKASKNKLFAFKDPRTSLLLPFWKQTFEYCDFQVCYIIATRHPLSVVRSLGRRDGFDEVKSYLLWFKYILSCLVETNKEQRIIVDFDNLLQFPQRELCRIAENFKLTVDKHELQQYISGFLEEGLRHATHDVSDLLKHPYCLSMVHNLYEIMLDLAEDGGLNDHEKLSKKLVELDSEWHKIRPLLSLIDSLYSRLEKLGVRQNEATEEIHKQILRMSDLDQTIRRLNSAIHERDGEISQLRRQQDEQRQKINQIYLGTKDNLFTKLGCKLHRVSIGKQKEFQTFKASIRNSPLFDPKWYREAYADIKGVKLSPEKHFFFYGAIEGRQPCPYFLTTWYLNENQEVLSSGQNPLLHYIEIGDRLSYKPNPYFDVSWYKKEYGDEVLGHGTALEHYIRIGAAEGRKPNPYFDVAWYIEKYPEVVENNIEPLLHYLLHGAREGYRPNPYFDPGWYLRRYPEVAKLGIDPLVHYSMKSASEIVNPNPYFDSLWYLQEYEDVAKSGIEPLLHYIQCGGSEGRLPGPYFDSQWYLNQYQDVNKKGLEPLCHYIYFGAQEGRNPSPYFDCRWYLEKYQDVKRMGVEPLAHYIEYGIKEERSPNPFFNSYWYVRKYPDVARSGIDPLLHYIQYGAREGRSPNENFNVHQYIQENPDATQNGMDPLLHALQKEAHR